VSERPIRAAFQGERGAFSEEASRRFFGPEVPTLPCREFEEMFAAVDKGAADAAVVPVENTLAGSVIKNFDLLLEHDLPIVGEVVVRVVHNLIALPGATVAGLRRVSSHPVALAQCESFLRAHPHLEAVAAYDTAGAVKMLVESGRTDEAAIAAAGAATAWGAQILLAGIESNPLNFTRFVVVTQPARVAEFARFGGGRPHKTTIVLRVSNTPGSLHHALAAFADQRIDLVKIESRPIPGRPWEYSFYLDLSGHQADPKVAQALAQLSGEAESLRVLGSYPRAET
jgi:prephenate dehydratase